MSCKYNNCKHCGYKSECEIYKENAEAKEIIREFITWGDGLEEYDPENPEEYTKAWHKLFDRIKAFLKE